MRYPESRDIENADNGSFPPGSSKAKQMMCDIVHIETHTHTYTYRICVRAFYAYTCRMMSRIIDLQPYMSGLITDIVSNYWCTSVYV